MAFLDSLFGTEIHVRNVYRQRHCRRTRHEVSRLRAEWSVRTSSERHLWLNRFGLYDGPEDRDRLCRCLLTGNVTHSTSAEPLLLKRPGWPATRMIRAICQLIPADELAALCFGCRGESTQPFSRVADELFAIASAGLRRPIALLLTPAAKAALFDREHTSRALAFLREGIVDLSKLGDERSVHPREDAGDSSSSGKNREAAALTSGHAEDDEARSAAERFLFEVLEATPASPRCSATRVSSSWNVSPPRQPASITSPRKAR